ncbi:MAG: LCP family protein [Lachnospiraceae bacterium]|nr:LCP family protein [Lachnospiraceae bacterium]
MWKKIVFGFLMVLSILAGFLAAKAQVAFFDTLNHVQRDYDTVLENVDLSGIKVNSDDDIVNILVVGNDYRKEKNYTASGLTDTMIIATMDLKHGTLKMASLMRDNYVDIPGYGYNKLNAANSFGGIELLYKTIATNFNIELDGYVEVGFKAFTDVVDAVGGVELELTESEAEYLNTTNYIRKKDSRNVKVGKQTLNGAQALGYCRIRKKGITITGLRDDYGRTWRQRTVIKAVFDKVKSLPMTEWLNIANKLLGNIKTDLTNDKIIDYVTDCVRLGTTEIHQLQVPLEGYYRSSYPGEFSAGDCLVMTDGVSSTLSPTANAEALNNFIFKYNGKQPFTYGSYTGKEE